MGKVKMKIYFLQDERQNYILETRTKFIPSLKLLIKTYNYIFLLHFVHKKCVQGHAR